jgi:2-octaprenyl-6-methoxyphenol hydroxylase
VSATAETVDAIVVGGGLVGLAAAAAVASAGLKTIHLSPKGLPDRRTSALMRPAVDYLCSSGLVADPAALGTPLTAIRIVDATDRLIRAPETLFEAADAGIDAFGWNFPNVALSEAFAGAIAALPNLETRDAALTSLALAEGGALATLATGDTIAAELVVGADGKRSAVRSAAGITTKEREYEEAALVADLELGRPLDGASVEFHYPHGPFTFVPAGGSRANLVWIDERPVLDAAKAAGPAALSEILRERSMRLFGRIEVRTPAQVFPLSTLSVDRAGGHGIVLVGEAAHAFPPIGAQGLNLGLRDVADLAESLGTIDRQAAGWALAVSEDYADRRAGDLARTGTMVDTLFRSLLSEMLPAQALRAGGLWALKLAPALRRQAFAAGMGER